MTGAIIYFKEAVKGNENYIKWYIEKFTKKGVDFKLIYVEDIDYNNCTGSYKEVRGKGCKMF